MTKRVLNVAVAWTCWVENVNVTPAGIARDGWTSNDADKRTDGASKTTSRLHSLHLCGLTADCETGSRSDKSSSWSPQRLWSDHSALCWRLVPRPLNTLEVDRFVTLLSKHMRIQSRERRLRWPRTHNHVCPEGTSEPGWRWSRRGPSASAFISISTATGTKSL